jgi:adenine-specific DNA-methyltransferase
MNTTNSPTPPQELSHSPDALAQRQAELLALIRQTVPEVMADNQVDVDKLKALLGQERVADPQEHYELNWAGKTAARREIQKTTSHTLLPSAGNPENAPHMLIEGENLEVLRVLQKSYYGKVKMIYIDPPYNTGNDSFVYPDDYSETLDEYQKRTGEKSANGYLNKQSLWKKNSKESGQYHSAWLSMMYPRLYLARNLLRDDGVIFISIDDNEAANLKLLCDEIFGTVNFVELFTWHKKNSAKGVPPKNMVVNIHEYILCYSKNQNTKLTGEKRTEDAFANPDNDHRGLWRRSNIKSTLEKPKDKFTITDPKTGNVFTNYWAFSRETLEKMIVEARILFPKELDGLPKQKEFMNEFANPNMPIKSHFGLFHSQDISEKKVEEMMGAKLFLYRKPMELMKKIIEQGTSGDEKIILDFFAGSGTTAQAVMELNLEDGGNRQCICAQIPEVLEETSEAYKAGYRTIADITRARIDKVIAKLKTEHPDKAQDLACAHFTLAPSNFKVWRGDVNTADALRDQLALFQRAEKSGQAQATDAQTAMLAELLLKHGLGALGVHAISKPKEMAGATVHRVLLPDDKAMWLCFDPYTEALKTEIVKAQPAQVVMLNSCFVGTQADEQLANLQLELAGLDIGLTVI